MIDFYTIAFIASILIAVALISGIKVVQIRVRKSPLLVIIALSMVANAAVFLTVGILLYTTRAQQAWIGNILNITMCTMFCAAYVYFEMLHTYKAKLAKTLFFWSFFLVTMVILFVIAFYAIEVESYFYLGTAINFSYGFVVMLYATIILTRTLRVSTHKGLVLDRWAVISGMIGAICFVALGVLMVIGDYELNSLVIIILMGIGCSGYAVGLGFLGYNSLKHRDYVYLMPFPIHYIMVYNQGGLTAFSKQVHVKGKDNHFSRGHLLFSGALQGFSSFFKEMLGQETKIQSISLDTHHFIMEQLPLNSGTFLVITSDANYFLKRSISDIAQSVPEDVLEEMNEVVNVGKLEKIFENLLKKHLPYLEFNNEHES